MGRCMGLGFLLQIHRCGLKSSSISNTSKRRLNVVYMCESLDKENSAYVGRAGLFPDP